MWPPRSCLWLALVLLVGVAQGQSSSREHFEDADKSSEYTDQQYDLRHTIPGEPGLDYPILSAPPKTSFVCKGRHEGYYADVESRCQAFRICAHTARSPQGFGFLCPNGTLFSQKNFVCDWYRNVNCDDSERYYEMNEEKSVGSTHEMMERVRHMMEYPMKTISKALQQTQSQSPNPHYSLSKDLSGASGVLSQPAAIKPNEPQDTKVVGRGEAVKSEPLNAVKTGIATDENDDEGIYVNSLGELSSDPGIQFDHTNAHIVAEYPREYHYQKQKNFAERVNAGLDLLTDTESTSGEVMAPDYIKHIRNTKDEAVQIDLVSNINNLLDEVSTDVDPSVSGYQSMAPPKVKQPFRFLSRGFSMQGENGKGSSSTGYGYIKPKQTASTVRFTPNEIPTEDHKSIEHKHKFSKTASTSSSTTSTTTESVEQLLIAPTLPPAEDEEVTTTTVAPKITTTLAAEPLSFLAPPPPEVVATGEVPPIESIGQAAALTASLPISEDLTEVELSPETAEKNDVHHEAAKLLLAGVQLTSHDEEKSLERNEIVVTSTTTSSPITPAMQTSTEVVTEISSTQERVRGYRKNRPGAMLKRAHIRPLPIVRTTAASTTPRSIPTTRSYLERLAASRLRLSRLSQATRSTTKATTTTASTTTTSPRATTTISSFQQVRGGAEPGPNKKLTVRDIDRETKIAPNKASWESVHSNLQRFQVQRGNRVYTPATRASVSSISSGITSSSTTTPRSYVAATSSRSTATLNRGKNRYSNFKTQAPVQRTRGTTTPRSTTVRPTSSLFSLNQHISALASNYNGGYAYTQAPQISKPIQQSPSHVYATHTASDIAAHASQSQSTSSLSPASAFLSFDKLTRAIVDESILQNFKSAQSQGSHQQQQQQQHQQQQQQRQQHHQAVKQQHHSVSSSYVKPAAAPAISSLTVPPRPQQAPQLSELASPPGIVIARAEGQRIAPNSASNIISNLATQAPVTNNQGNSYVSLNDFLNNKFGQSPASTNNIASAATLQQQQRLPQQQQHYQQQRVQKQPAQQQHVQQQQRQPVQQQQVPQQQRQPVQQQHTPVQQQHTPVQQQHTPVQHQQQLSFISQQYQQPQQQNVYQQYQQPQQQQHFQQQQQRPTIHTIQQPYLTPNIFVPYQQQQQQLPQFPPLAPPVAVSPGNIAQGPVIAGRHVDHLNVQLPTLGNGLIPGLQLAQKRSDVSASQLQLTDAPGKGSLSGSGKSRERAFYAGRTSYDVPQSSVGRLPNDVTQQLRRRLRRF
ncbi:protein split ends [Drosophila rhopaloa]|uniref:Protein split ends n=1 Tax=Drosophila rhopaloa TaxID=1041015 RepID=A0A6P4F6B3_DRORH|nr:protein split ends [Drosophila rhopaloa]